MKRRLWRGWRRVAGAGLMEDVLRAAHPRRALLLYRVEPFRFPQAREHQNQAQARELARALDRRGFCVDVADAGTPARRLAGRRWHVVIDLHPTDPAPWADGLEDGALRLAYITGSNPRFSNAAERERLGDLERRRGVRLSPRRQVPEFSAGALEPLDGFLTFAGRTALATYREFRLPPVHRLVNSAPENIEPTDPVLRRPDRFLFLASSGQVHKGLDLVLEAVASVPRAELVVCSLFAKERDFVEAYRAELFGLDRVVAAGFLDIHGERFRGLQAGCGAVILPSCAEAQCGSLTVAMAFGLPVVMSRACDLDEPDLVTLPDCAPGTIRETVERMIERSAHEVREAAERSATIARERYRPEDYRGSVEAALDAALQGAGSVR